MQDRRQIKNTDNIQTKDNPEKQTMQNTAKQNNPGLVAFYNAQPGNEVGLFYNTPEPTWGLMLLIKYLLKLSKSTWQPDRTTINGDTKLSIIQKTLSEYFLKD